jgi:transposase-like protein
MDKKIKTYIYIALGLATAAGGYAGYRKISKDVKQKAASKALTTGGNKALGINIADIAKQLGIEMGFAYPWYDPRRATENDLATRILVMKVPKPYIPQLSKEYARFYPGRNLSDDLRTTNDAWDDFKYLFGA